MNGHFTKPDKNSVKKHKIIHKNNTFLPYEYIIYSLTGSEKNTKRYLTYVIILITVLNMTIFLTFDDWMMCFTSLSIGLLWITVLWATFRFRKLFVESQSNFVKFLKPEGEKSKVQNFNDIVSKVIGSYPIEYNGIMRIITKFWKDILRFLLILIGSIIGTLCIFKITIYNTFSVEAGIVYGVIIFLFFLSFLYLLSNLILFHYCIRGINAENNNFSLVQHPKFSIRYLSYLSRRISYPFLIVFIMATFTLYLGPFIANKLFIGALLSLIIFNLFIYYSSFFFVRKIINNKKMEVINEFSDHFKEPLELMIKNADPKKLNKLKELHEMRDFIDSIDVWAEKKSVLIINSLVYLAIIIFSTIVISNTLTNYIVPPISKFAEKNNKSDIPEKGYLLDESIINDNISVKVDKVDDTVVIAWGDSFLGMINQMQKKMNKNKESPGSEGWSRCDWENGDHGKIDKITIPYETEKHIFYMAYNKHYNGFLKMGGGKLSYSVIINQKNGEHFFRRKAFVRYNEPCIGHAAYLHIKCKGDKVYINENEYNRFSDISINNKPLYDFIKGLNGENTKFEEAFLKLEKTLINEGDTQANIASILSKLQRIKKLNLKYLLPLLPLLIILIEFLLRKFAN